MYENSFHHNMWSSFSVEFKRTVEIAHHACTVSSYVLLVTADKQSLFPVDDLYAKLVDNFKSTSPPSLFV
jgi:hypothetical protein